MCATQTQTQGKYPKYIHVDIYPTDAPWFNNNVVGKVTADDDIVLPLEPYYNYPFAPAASLTEYVVFRVLHAVDLYDEYRGKTYDDVENDLIDAARLLNKKYAIHIDEEGDGQFDLVIFTDDEKLVDLLKEIECVINREIRRYWDRGGTAGEHENDIKEKVLNELPRLLKKYGYT